MTLPDKKKSEITEKQNNFLDALFDNGGDINEAMLTSDRATKAQTVIDNFMPECVHYP